MSLILGFLLTGVAAVAGTVLCPPPAGRAHDRDRLPVLALASLLAVSAALASHPAGAAERLPGHGSAIDGSCSAGEGIR